MRERGRAIFHHMISFFKVAKYGKVTKNENLAPDQDSGISF